MYNIAKLKTISGLNLENALTFYVSYQSLFDALDSFVSQSKSILRDYTPSVVVYSPEIRVDFIAEVKAAQEWFINLGLIQLAVFLNELESAAGRSEKALSDGLLVFSSELDIITRKITAAREKEPETPFVLAVGDRPELPGLLKRVFEGRFSVVSAAGGKAALKTIQKQAPVLFMLTAELPDMSGYELAAQLRKQKRFEKIPIVFLSNSPADIIIPLQNGLITPDDEKLLLSKLRTLPSFS